MTTITKLKAALAALEESRDDVQFAADENDNSGYSRSEKLAAHYTEQLAKHDQSVTGLRSVIAEMEAGEPVSVGKEGFVRVLVDTKPSKDGWCFCSPAAHPEDIANGNSEPFNGSSQFYGQVFTHPQPKAEPVQQQEFTNRLRELCGLHSGDHPAASMRQREFIRDFAPKGQPKAEPVALEKRSLLDLEPEEYFQAVGWNGAIDAMVAQSKAELEDGALLKQFLFEAKKAGITHLNIAQPKAEPVTTGWNSGLSQDYDKGLGTWFADRLGARQQLREDMAKPVQEPIAWRCKGEGLKRFLSQRQYDAQTDATKEWYEPYKCASCAAAPAPQPKPEPVQCLDCGSNNIGLPANYDSVVKSVVNQKMTAVVQETAVFARRWSLAYDGFGVQRDDENGVYVYIDDALEVLHRYAAAPQAKPLTDDQMWSLWNAQGVDEMQKNDAFAFARAIEAAHNIGGGK